MRIHIKTTPSQEIVPFNYQPVLTGALHKWLGENDLHDQTSLYSFSWLQGGSAQSGGLSFTNGASFFFSCFNNETLKNLIEGVNNDPSINYGMEVSEIKLCNDPEFQKEEMLFFTGSPVLVKKETEEGREHHYQYDDIEASEILTQTLKTKLIRAGLSHEGVEANFEANYPKAKTKVVYYNKIGNRVNLCPINIKGSPEQLAFAWNVGIGNSTGIGFGALK